MVSIPSFRLRIVVSFLSDSAVGVIYVVCMLTWCRLCLYLLMARKLDLIKDIDDKKERNVETCCYSQRFVVCSKSG